MTVCARCGVRADGIPLGGLCPACMELVRRRASRLARWVSLATGAALAAYLMLALRSVAPPWAPTSRVVGAMAVAAWCLLTYQIVKRIGLEWRR